VSLPLFLVLYAFYTFFLTNYNLPFALATIIAVLAACRALQQRWPAGSVGRLLPPLLVTALALSQLPEFTHRPDDPEFHPACIAAARLPERIHTPAVVLFRFHHGNNPHDEPVYNIDVTWPDDARIIRAHTFGLPKDAEIFQYYSERQPQRMFYVLDRADNSLSELGTAQSLAKRDRDEAPK
jgi:hypothetical protein